MSHAKRKRRAAMRKRLKLYERRVWEIHDDLVEQGEDMFAGSDSLTGCLDQAANALADAILWLKPENG